MGVTWREHARAVAALEAVAARPAPERADAAADFTLTLNAFRRPENIPLLTHLALATPSVREVVISHNDPSIPLPLAPHPRVRVVRRDGPYGPIGRYSVALEARTDLFLSVDDDLFLHPDQLERLAEEARGDASAPHGFYGQLFDGRRFRYNRGRSDGRVDVLNRAYAFTREHLDRYCALLDLLGLSERERRRLTMDDVVLAFCGAERPRAHDLGPHVDCPTEHDQRIAIFRRRGEHARRAALYARLEGLVTRRRGGPDALPIRDPRSPRRLPLRRVLSA